MSVSSFRSVLANRNFAKLWWGQIISSIGDRFYQLALLKVAIEMEGGFAVGKESARIAFCGMLPGLLFAPYMGWAVDRYTRKGVLIFADLARVALTLSFLYFLYVNQSLSWVYALIFAMGGLNGLFITGRQAALPQIVPHEKLVTANALISLVGVIASLVGSVFAGLVIAIFGAKSSFLINAAGFLVSASLIFWITSAMPPQRQSSSSVGLKHNWRELAAGWNVLRERPALQSLVWINVFFSFASGLFVIVLMEHALKSLDLSLATSAASWLTQVFAYWAPKPPHIDVKFLSLGLLLAAVGIGLGLGVVFCGKAKTAPRWRGLPFVSLLLMGITFYGFGWLQSFGPVLVCCMGLGFLASVIPIPLEAQLQHEIDDERRGRVFALRNFCTTGAFLVALAINLDGRLLALRGASRMIQDLGIFVTLGALVLIALNRAQFTKFWIRSSALPASIPESC